MYGKKSGKLEKQPRLLRLCRLFLCPRVYFLLALGVSTTAVGCTRKFFRERADIDAIAMIHEKDKDPRWQLANYYVYPDSRARFADWSNPDRPPMPPDDIAAQALSPIPQRPGAPGVAYIVGKDYLEVLAAWDAENRAKIADEEARGVRLGISSYAGTAGAISAADELALSAIPSIDNELSGPVAVDRALPTKPKEPNPNCQKPFLINLEQAVELAFFNSRELQTQREAVFLAALPVTAERFAFATQFYAIEQLFRDRFGSQLPDGPANTWRASSTLGFSKLFSTGALLLAQFANQTVVNLGNLNGKTPIKTLSTSTVSLDIVQPLLRGGGRAVTLEPLTQSERNLLYTIRDYARFLQQFYVYIAAGQPAFIPGIQAGVSALSAGSVTQIAPFVPFATALQTGVAGPNAFPQVVPGQGGGRQGPIGSSTPIPQGFLPTVQNKAQLVIQFNNVKTLARFLQLFRVYLEGGLVNPVQVGSVEQSLLEAVEAVLTSQASYRINLDELKIQLGLPTNMAIEVDDTPLVPMFRLQNLYEVNTQNFISLSEETLKLNKLEPVSRLREELRQRIATSALSKDTNFRTEMPKRWAEWEKLGRRFGANDPVGSRLSQLRAERRKILDAKAELENKNQTLPPEEQRRLNNLDIEIEIGLFERALREYEEQPWMQEMDPARRLELRGAFFLTVHRMFLTLMEGAFREHQDQIRAAWPPLPPLCVDGVDLLSADDDVAMAAVARAALTNRLDLMNQRAQLVDFWRKIRVSANSLLGIANVEYHLDSTTPAELAQPFNFSGSRSRHELIFNLQPPLVRRIERNNYRSTLIAFQQERRTVMAAQDQVLYAVRLDLRNLRATANTYLRLEKRALELAYSQVDQALEAFNQPAQPAGPSGIPGFVGAPATGGGGGDPAALTTQLLNAQRNLVAEQQDLYGIWISYLTTRMALYRDMGIMPLDARGVWIDDPASCDCQSPIDAGYRGPGSDRPENEYERLPEPGSLPSASGATPEQ